VRHRLREELLQGDSAAADEQAALRLERFVEGGRAGVRLPGPAA
jgi:hypothetical protein